VSIPKSERIVGLVATRCKQLRTSKKLTHQDVLNDTGINIGRIESGSMDITITTVQKLADYFGVSVPEFFQTD